MGTNRNFVVCRRHWRPALLVVGMMVMAVLTGCSTTSNAIRAAELPPRLRAERRVATPPIDLSVLARRSMNSDLIYPGDELDITVVIGDELQPPDALRLRATADGNVVVPEVGSVRVVGKSMTEAESAIQMAAVERRIYRNPTVSVVLGKRETDKVRVVGAVKEPGVYELPKAGSDLLAAIVAAGGLAEEAGTAIRITHPAGESGITPVSFESGADRPQSLEVDLVDAMQSDAGDLSLQDGSIVMVKEELADTIYVQGLVKQAGEYELPEDKPLRIDQAIALANGRESEFADVVHVTRFTDDYEDPIVIEVSLKDAKQNRNENLILMPGDVVSVEETPLTFSVDFIRNFFRFGFSTAIPGF